MPKARIWDATNGQWLVLDAQNANRAQSAALADDASKLGGKDPSYYAAAADVTAVSDALTTHKASTTDHANATQTANGFMSKEDKTKLDGVSTGANKVTVATEGSGFIEIDGVSKKVVDSLNAGNVTQDATHRFVTDTQITSWNGKLDSTKVGAANGVASLDANGLVPVSQLPNLVKEGRVVADIAARNAVADPFAGLHVLVLDATADTTVKSGAAEYVYDGTKFIKVSEVESLDVVLEWANIQNKPSSTVADIDDAVTKRHIHANEAILDAITAAYTTEEKTKLAGIADGATKVVASGTNGHVTINGIDVEVYKHPATHTSAEISDFATAVKAIKVDAAVTADNALAINGYKLYIGAAEPTDKANGTIWIDAAI
jgi:hypothetical protein